MRSLASIFLLWALAAAAFLEACGPPRSQPLCPPGSGAATEQRPADCPDPEPPAAPPVLATRAVDILFMIDNSPSMTPKQKALAQNIPRFIQKIDAAVSDYHVGIVTSDVGTDQLPGLNWGGNVGSCDTYAGDDGQLQALPCTQRSWGSAEARAACDRLCPDDRYAPVDGSRFIAKSGAGTNVPIKLEPDPMTGMMTDVGPIKAFQCLALVGDSGCGAEGQLEAARRALDGHRTDNAGFLRPGSFLAVVYITDEDDCSVQLKRRSENNPQTRDCDPAAPDAYDCYNLDYRCLARSTTCNETLLTPGNKTGCTERPDNYLEPIETYRKFFSFLRRPERLLISGIWTLPAADRGGRVEIVREWGLSSTPGLNRASGMGASCFYSADPSVFGRPQHRLSKFARTLGRKLDGTPSAIEVSICDVDRYAAALGEIADAIVSSATFPQ